MCCHQFTRTNEKSLETKQCFPEHLEIDLPKLMETTETSYLGNDTKSEMTK